MEEIKKILHKLVDELDFSYGVRRGLYNEEVLEVTEGRFVSTFSLKVEMDILDQKWLPIQINLSK